jgi:uncharacterized Tic20 family protein
MNDDRVDRLQQIVPLKFRSIAFIMYAIAAIPSGSVLIAIAFYTGFYSYLRDTDKAGEIIASIIYEIEIYYVDNITCITIGLIIIPPILNWLLWKYLSSIHSFIDLSGRDATNAALSMMLGILFCCTLLYIVTGGGPGLAEPNLMLMANILFFICLPISYLLNSLVAGIFALRGQHFKSYLVYQFIRNKIG